jgi:hypothetical protein
MPNFLLGGSVLLWGHYYWLIIALTVETVDSPSQKMAPLQLFVFA